MWEMAEKKALRKPSCSAFVSWGVEAGKRLEGRVSVWHGLVERLHSRSRYYVVAKGSVQSWGSDCFPRLTKSLSPRGPVFGGNVPTGVCLDQEKGLSLVCIITEWWPWTAIKLRIEKSQRWEKEFSGRRWAKLLRIRNEKSPQSFLKYWGL